MTTARPNRRCASPRGFALIVTLTLMVLLAILALGLLSLSAVTLRTTSQQQLALEAQQNARLALMLAIGELQSLTGPDQRVTAPASILGADEAQPHLTGVWEGWKWDGTGDPDFKGRKKSRFLRWLVSSRDESLSRSLDFTKAKPTGEVVTLLRGSRDPSFGDQVDAQIVPVLSAKNNLKHGMAWAVFDESTKLPVSLTVPEDKTPGAEMERLLAAPFPGYEAVTARDWSPLALLGEQRAKLVTADEAALAGLAASDRSFHDLTSRSAGVIADVAKGGLAVDLSRLFSDPNGLPTGYGDRFLYSGTSTPLAPPPVRFAGANPFPSPDPSWNLLRSHYRLYDKLTGGQNSVIASTTTARPVPGTTGQALLQHPFFQSQQLVPVIAKAQFVFSLSFGWHGTLAGVQKPGNGELPDTDPNKDLYITWLVVDPVITLWNPYNVNLSFPGGRIDLYRVPLTFRLYKNGSLVNSEYTHLANCFLESDFTNRKDTFYRLNLLPEKGKSEIILAPGEHLVLTAANHVKTFNNAFSDVGLDLRPGFTPPAANASASEVGGVSTLNVCVSPNGAPNGSVYGKTVRTVPVKPGDIIQMEVKQGRASVDKPAETGGKEVSGYLKYFVGSPSNPQRVGGIELDYGEQEPEYLPPYSINDLPSLVVSNLIPKNVQADNYQGGKPPPVVRFKEPFLISTFQLKTERDAKFPSRGWIHNSPVNLYASEGLDQKEPWANQQYELQWEAMTDWPPASPTIEISNTNNRGYGGPGIYAQSGLEFATHSSIPAAPAISLAQLRHAPLNTGGQLPLVSQVVANSFAPPILAPSSIRTESNGRSLLDHSFYANSALFDGYFFSTLAEPGGPLGRTPLLNDSIKDFFENGKHLANSRLIPYRGGLSMKEITETLTAPDAYLKAASLLLIDSPLNVNSTRVDVWEAFLNSTFGSNVPQRESGSLISATGKDAAFSRHLPSNGSSFEDAGNPLAGDLAKWNGHRRLTPEQIRRLAEEIVAEIRSRGPFQSVAEFVNRRPGTDSLAQSGALQAALERAEINKNTTNAAFSVGNGNAADGSPGVLSQADLLNAIAPTLSARGDTFRIRAYGEAGPPGGTKVRAWCEAVVQRIPGYVDAGDQPWDAPKKTVNVKFGRRYEIVSFRWLSASEI
jgi:Tfp pilus assembly protein PilV